jgi:hypothetical protein
MPSITVTTTPTEIVPRRGRNSIGIQNVSGQTVYIGHTPEVTVADGPHSGIPIPVGLSFFMNSAEDAAGVRSAIYGVTATGEAVVRYLEN